MKKTFILALIAAAAMTSCSNDDTVVSNENNAIDFRTVTANTKATVVDNDNIKDFSVSAYTTSTASAVTAVNGFNYFDGITVIRAINGASTWSYSPKKYWPSDAGTVDFFAYSPAGSVNLASFVYAASAATLTYTVQDNVASTVKKQEDLLFAKALTQTKTASPVALAFNHALSQVAFEAKNLNTADVVFKVEKIELVGLNQTGTLDAATAVVGDVWATPSSPVDYLAGIPAAGVPVYGGGVGATYIGLTAPNEGLMVLPQTIALNAAGDRTVRITFSATDGSGAYIYPVGSTKTFDLAKSAAFTFGLGKKYTFQFAFAAETGITFTANVVAWDAPNNTEIAETVIP